MAEPYNVRLNGAGLGWASAESIDRQETPVGMRGAMGFAVTVSFEERNQYFPLRYLLPYQRSGYLHRWLLENDPLPQADEGKAKYSGSRTGPLKKKKNPANGIVANAKSSETDGIAENRW